MWDVLIQKDNSVILPDQLLETLKIAPGDKITFKISETGDVKVKKLKASLNF